MSQVRGSNTGLEKIVFKELSKRGVYFQRHYKKAPGKPDIALPKKKIAVFIDSDFWHGYRYPAWKKRIKIKYWRNKVEKNRYRDKRNLLKLRRMDWKVLRVWEHQLKKTPQKMFDKIARFLKRGVSSMRSKTD